MPTSFERAIDLAQQAQQKYGFRIAVDVIEADEPIQLTDAYNHLRIAHDSNGSDDDAWLTAQIPAAREWCELEVGRALATRTIEIAASAFPTITRSGESGPYIELPFGPVQSITSVKYLVEQEVTDSNGDTVLDSNGDAVTEVVELTLDAATYSLDTFVTPNRLVLGYGKSWPTTALATPNSVKIRYVAGYVAEPESNGFPVLPRAARSAMLLMLGHLYENREAVNVGNLITQFPLGVHSLLELIPNRERLGMA